MDNALYDLDTQEDAYNRMMIKNWLTPISGTSGFNVNDRDLINYLKKLDQRNAAQAFAEDNVYGLLGSLGWSIHPVAGAIGTGIGMLEDINNAKRNYAWNLYKQLTNNEQKSITQEEYEAAFNADLSNKLAAKDAAISGLIDLTNFSSSNPLIKRTPFKFVPFLKRIVRDVGKEVASEKLQEYTDEMD